MFGFLQGLAYGLFLSCPIWFFIGMMNPAAALPTERPNRLQVVFRYWFAVPCVAFLLWVTSLWGGFGPSLMGWLAGLVLIPASLPVERGWRRWRRRRAPGRNGTGEAKGGDGVGESGLLTLDGSRPPTDTDPVVKNLWSVRRELRHAGREDLAILADRLYTRYHRLRILLGQRFEPGELTLDRSRALVADVCLAAVDDLTAMADRARALQGLDVRFVRRRLAVEQGAIHADERSALERRLRLAEDAEAELAGHAARLEGALTALDHAMMAVSRMQTGRSRTSVDARHALQELNRFAQRTERYERRGTNRKG